MSRAGCLVWLEANKRLQVSGRDLIFLVIGSSRSGFIFCFVFILPSGGKVCVNFSLKKKTRQLNFSWFPRVVVEIEKENHGILCHKATTMSWIPAIVQRKYIFSTAQKKERGRERWQLYLEFILFIKRRHRYEHTEETL